jgi:hypothetical protein
LGRVVKNISQNFDGSLVYKDTYYNAKGQVQKISEPYTSAPTTFTLYNYDSYNRPTSVSSPTNKISYSYSSKKQTTNLYDLSNNLIESKTQTFNCAGELISVADAGGTINYYYYSTGLTKKILIEL